MELHPILQNTPAAETSVRITPTPFRKFRHFGAFLICCALFVAGFALTALWRNADGEFWKREEGTTPPENTLPPQLDLPNDAPIPDKILIPEGATPIVDYDLAYIGKGVGYINNETFYKPNVRNSNNAMFS